MLRSRVSLRLLAATLLVLAVPVALPGTATAAPLHAAPSGSCPGSQAYPPTADATVEASSTAPAAGASIEVSGVHYCGNEDVTITIAGKTAGTAHTDAQGSFDPEVVVPGPSGAKQLCGVGASGLAADADCLTLTVQTAGGQAEPASGGTAFTGADIALIVAVAVLLLAGGVAFSTAGRRRRKSTTSG